MAGRGGRKEGKEGGDVDLRKGRGVLNYDAIKARLESGNGTWVQVQYNGMVRGGGAIGILRRDKVEKRKEKKKEMISNGQGELI